MQIQYKNKCVERILIGVNALTATAVVGFFVRLFGFDEPLLPVGILHTVQFVLLLLNWFIFITPVVK